MNSEKFENNLQKFREKFRKIPKDEQGYPAVHVRLHRIMRQSHAEWPHKSQRPMYTSEPASSQEQEQCSKLASQLMRLTRMSNLTERGNASWTKLNKVEEYRVG